MKIIGASLAGTGDHQDVDTYMARKLGAMENSIGNISNEILCYAPLTIHH